MINVTTTLPGGQDSRGLGLGAYDGNSGQHDDVFARAPEDGGSEAPERRAATLRGGNQ